MGQAIRQARANSKIPELCTRLRDLAVTLADRHGPHAKLPTTRDLCLLLDTSKASLDMALSELEKQNVIYRKPSSGIFVSPKISRKTICILLDSSFLKMPGASPFWGVLWGHFADEAQKRSRERNEYYSLHLVISPPEQDLPLPEEFVTMLQSGKVHGVLVVGLDNPTSAWITEQHIPCVTFAGYGPWTVTLDSTEMTRMGIANLADQGCRNIEMWMPVIDTGINWQEKYALDTRLFRYFLADHHLTFYPERVRTYLDQAGSRHNSAKVTGPLLDKQTQGYLTAREAFRTTDGRPDGIFISDDMMTEGVIAGLLSLGIHAGEEVRIVSHANVGTLVSWERIPGITLLEYDHKRIVAEMFTMLDTLLAGSQPTQKVTTITPDIRQIYPIA